MPDCVIKVWRMVKRNHDPFYYIDNAYFGRHQYFRVTKNALQCSGKTRPDFRRLRRLRVRITDWRRGGSHIVLCPHSDYFHKLMLGDANAREWIDRTTAELRQYTDREIRVRWKDTETPLLSDLVDCWSLVTPQSNAAVEAVMAGVPIFVTGQSAARPVGLADLSRIETPLREVDREHWAACLAGNQWTARELRDGICWRAVA